MGKTIGLLLTALGVAALVGAALWLRSDADAPGGGPGRPPFRLPVTLGTLERGSLRPTVTLTGNLRAPERARLALESGGLLLELAVREGERFERGDVLAGVRSSAEELARERATAELELARRQLTELEAGVRAEERARLAAVRDERAADLALAVAELERGQKLSQDDFLSRSGLDRLAAERDAASARLAAAEQDLVRAEAGPREVELQVARARVQVAEANLAQAAERLDRTRLVAPFDGVVVQRLASVGEFLTPGAAVLEAMPDVELEVELEVPPRVASRVRVGAAVDLYLEGADAPLRGTLDVLVPSADPTTRHLRALVRPGARSDASLGLVPGAFARVDLELATLEDVWIAPLDALRADQEVRRIVLARDGGEAGRVAELLEVRVLDVQGDRMALEPLDPEVVLEPGQELVLTGADLAFPQAPLLVAGGGRSAGGAGPGGDSEGDADPAGADGAQGER